MRRFGAKPVRPAHASAAGYVRAARARGIPTCEVNLEPSDTADAFDHARYGKAGTALPAFLTELGL